MLAVVVTLAIFGVSQAIVGMVWGLRLEGEVKKNKVAQDDLKELLISKVDDVRDRLGRIERSMNGSLHGH